MRQPGITLSDEARDTLGALAAAHGGPGVLRLKELQAVALTVGEPEDDDLVLRAFDGSTLLAVSRGLMDRLDGEAELVVGIRETGEPDFKLVQADGMLRRARDVRQSGRTGQRIESTGGEPMSKVWVGVAGAIGVVVGILFAPRKGSETRKAIVERTEPVQTAAKEAASKAGEVIAPVADKAGEWVPLIGKNKDGVDQTEEPARTAGRS